MRKKYLENPLLINPFSFNKLDSSIPLSSNRPKPSFSSQKYQTQQFFSDKQADLIRNLSRDSRISETPKNKPITFKKSVPHQLCPSPQNKNSFYFGNSISQKILLPKTSYVSERVNSINRSSNMAISNCRYFLPTSLSKPINLISSKVSISNKFKENLSGINPSIQKDNSIRIFQDLSPMTINVNAVRSNIKLKNDPKNSTFTFGNNENKQTSLMKDDPYLLLETEGDESNQRLELAKSLSRNSNVSQLKKKIFSKRNGPLKTNLQENLAKNPKWMENFPKREI